MKVAILGSGPAGLFATHAVVTAGIEPHVFSLGKKSRLYGAQYLHVPIPGLSPVDNIEVDYQLRGDPEGYRKKVYGYRRGITPSVAVLVGKHPAWDIRETYDRAWELYSPLVIKSDIDLYWMTRWVEIRKYDLVISTIPAFKICIDDRHRFFNQRVWAIGDAPDLRSYCPVKVSENTVVCNALKEPSWYRASNVFGHKTAEWPYGTKNRDLPNMVTLIKKPIGTDCDCWRENVLRLGRFGSWNKTALSHTAFYSTKEYLDERQQANQERQG